MFTSDELRLLELRRDHRQGLGVMGQALKNPTELGTAKEDYELMLVPEKTIEKLIVLGELKCPTSP